MATVDETTPARYENTPSPAVRNEESSKSNDVSFFAATTPAGVSKLSADEVLTLNSFDIGSFLSYDEAQLEEGVVQ